MTIGQQQWKLIEEPGQFRSEKLFDGENLQEAGEISTIEEDYGALCKKN
jgi:hypothetical protein